MLPAGTGIRRYLNAIVGSQEELDTITESREQFAKTKKRQTV